MSAFGRLCCKSAVDALRPRRRGDRVRRERSMNPKCQTRPGFDTFSAKSADLTGLKMRRITRAVSSFDHLVGAGEHDRSNLETNRPRGLDVDHQCESGRSFNWQISRLGSLENAIDVCTCRADWVR